MEVVIVLAVIGTMVAVSVGYYTDSLDNANRVVVRTNGKAVRDALQRYFKDRMAYPENLNELVGPYLSQSPVQLLQGPLEKANGHIYVYIPDSATKVNAFSWDGAFKYVKYDFASPNVGQQIRDIEIVVHNATMSW